MADDRSVTLHFMYALWPHAQRPRPRVQTLAFHGLLRVDEIKGSPRRTGATNQKTHGQQTNDPGNSRLKFCQGQSRNTLEVPPVACQKGCSSRQCDSGNQAVSHANPDP